MQEPRRDEQLFAVVKAELFTHPMPKGWAATPNVDGHIKQPTTPAAHQFCLCMRGRLEMQSPHRADSVGQGMIVLDKIDLNPVLGQARLIPCLAEKPTFITKAFWCDDFHI